MSVWTEPQTGEGKLRKENVQNLMTGTGLW